MRADKIGRASARAALVCFASLGAAHLALAQPLPNAAHLAVGAPLSQSAPVGSGETINLYVRLADAPLASVAGNKRSGMKMTAAQQRAYSAQLRQKQDALMAQIGSYGGQRLASLTNASNALVVEIAASQVSAVAKLPGVVQVLPVGDYQLHLTNTVPYVGAPALHGIGVDGSGVRVAVLDSGIDFMHRNLGGTGSVADYNFCYAQNAVAPSGICADYFGAAAPKVAGGFDFVGEAWVGGTGSPPLAQDPNPIARITTGGHGTHVADIIAGRSADGTHKGVAPGAKVYAVKVCSAISASCSGVAILQGFDWALDPNGDGDIADAVDVVNLSLGAPYGQRESSSVHAADTASKFGVVVVASAGNSANRPYITGSPSSTTSAISVAQTQVPTAQVVPLNVNSPPAIAGTISNTATMPWAPVGAGFAGDVKATAASPGSPPGNDACAALPPGSLSGKVALIRRGFCGVGVKITNATAAGAVGVIIDNNVPGDPPSFSQTGTPPYAPSLVVSMADGNRIRQELAAAQTVNVATGAALAAVGSLVTTSSRGPTMQIGMLKPDIGAPGASVSAEVGTGNGTTTFGGTSGAAPMVAGGAALLLQSFPTAQPHEIKARLMNAAETNITTYAGAPGPGNPLAPLSRIGAGELRVDRAHALSTAVWDASDPGAVSLSMGVMRNSGMQTLRKRVLVRNYANTARTYSIAPSFRSAADQASGAVNITAPATINVPANGSATFLVTYNVNANQLPIWQSTGISGGFPGGDGSLLDLPEYDGFIAVSHGGETARVPWHMLPHRAHNVVAPASLALSGAPSAPLNLSNIGGAVGGRTDVFYLTGTSPQIPASQLPAQGDSFAINDLRAVGVRLVSIGSVQFGVQFAVNMYGARSHPNYPGQISVFLDVDNNGTDDFEVRTSETGGFGATGQNVTFVRKITSDMFSGPFFTDADLQSGNVIMTIPMVATLPGAGPDLALTPNSTFRFRVNAVDNYFTGVVTDSIPQMQINLNNPRFFPSSFAATVPVGGASAVTVNRNAPGDAVSTSQMGLLLMYRDGKFGREADAVTVTP